MTASRRTTSAIKPAGQDLRAPLGAPEFPIVPLLSQPIASPFWGVLRQFSDFSRSDHQGVHRVWGTQLDETGHYQPIDLQ
jgi:hypothetical protein